MLYPRLVDGGMFEKSSPIRFQIGKLKPDIFKSFQNFCPNHVATNFGQKKKLYDGCEIFLRNFFFVRKSFFLFAWKTFSLGPFPPTRQVLKGQRKASTVRWTLAGVDVMVTIFCDFFSNFLRQKWAFSRKPML
jgi:hypothetical protein